MGVVGSVSIRIWFPLCGALLLGCWPCRAQLPTQEQQRSDTRATKDYGYNGEVSVQVQDTTGDPFFFGAAVSLFTQNVDARQTLRTTSDAKGLARFSALPVGTYVIEISAPGYRTVQQQVIITGTEKAENLVVSLVPSEIGKVRVGKVAASPGAVKETEKAMQALQGNHFDKAQQHLQRALTVDPSFSDANYLMGVALLRQKEPSKARPYLKKAVELAPDHAAAFLALGEAQYLEQDYAGAMDSLEKFLRVQQNSPQAAIAQKYVDAMRKVAPAAASGDGQMELASAGAAETNGFGGGANGTELPALPELNPVTEANWAPPDVDNEKLELDTSTGCELDDVVRSAGHRMQELVANVNRFTATENVEHIALSPMGLETRRETRKFKYVAEIEPVGSNDLAVEEYRTNSNTARDFPDGIETIGLSSLAMIFHPNLAVRYDFRCDGRGSWNGQATWVVHFQQRHNQDAGMLTYKVAGRTLSVGLRGRAWIDVKSMQILAMESDIVSPLPEIQLKRDHQLIQYGPVSFRNNSMQLWLPKSADWYCAISGKRFHRRHSFSEFLLFSVDDKQKISTPKIDPEAQ